jgi:hypothetical protein
MNLSGWFNLGRCSADIRAGSIATERARAKSDHVRYAPYDQRVG